MEQTIYAAAGGYDGLLRLARAWHERCLADPLAAHPFDRPGLHPQHLERLAAYWGEALGGPADYTATLGDESHVRRVHAGNGEHDELTERTVACFVVALADVGLDEPRLGSSLEAYFRWGAALMDGHPDTPDTVPDHLALPHWSWDGPVT